MSAGHDCRLLFVTDPIYGRRLLVDSGAQRSILPAQPVDTLADQHGPRMVGFGRRCFGCDFVIAAVCTSILGADFLCAFRLLVDVTNSSLIDAVSFTT